jgi:hypothetical protein
LSLEDFPKNFHPALYQHFKKITLEKLSAEIRKRYEGEDKKWFLDQLIRFEIDVSQTFKKSKVKEIVRVGEDEIKNYEQEHGKLELSNKGHLPFGAAGKLLELKKQNDFAKLSTEDIYKKDLYDKNDVFQIFASTYYDDTITNEFYPKIVVRLFEYKERAKPSSKPKDFNFEWVENFFKWFDKNGYYVINTKGFDPLRYDPKMFSLEKPRKQYEGKSLQKMINIMKDLSRKFAKRNLLPVVDLSELRLKNISKKKDRKGTRKEYAFTKEEFDTLFHFKIQKKDLPRYQQIFDSVHQTKRKVTIQELVTAKQMFICQVMFGGLRGWHDYETVKIKKHSKTVNKVAFHVGKKDDAIENPLNVYTLAILNETNFEKPFIDDEFLYRSLIKTVVRFIGFEKEIKKNKYQNDYLPIGDLFQPGFFARKTFAQILHSVGVSPQDIALFTGHEREDDELRISYLDANTIENKMEILKDLRVGKG